MEQFVINIGRQLGSGGRTVGEIIARRLGVKLYDKELINLAARESGICPEFFEKADEKESRGVISTVVGYLRAPFVGDDGGVTNVLSNDALFKIQSDVIRAVAARESAVFVGRCADYILRENPRCVNVFLTADDADRIGRIRSARLTGELFEKREIDRANLPLKFDFGNAELIGVKLSVAQKAVPDVEEWLGVDNIRVEGDEIFAEATLPAGEVLLSKLLSLGDGVRVLSPATLAKELRERAESLAKLY